MQLKKKLKSHLSALFAGTAACSVLFGSTPASADTPPDASLVAGMDSLDAARTDLHSRVNDTRIVTQAATTTAESRLVSRHETNSDHAVAAPVRRRPLSRIMHRIETTQSDGGGTLLFSDSPEYATEDGILYRDTVQGAARVLYYHVNRMEAPKKVAIVLENLSKGTSMVTISRGGASLPSPHYLDVGKATQALYFDEQQTQRFFLKKGESRVLVSDMGKTLVQPEDLVYGCYDFTTTQAVRTSVVICPADVDPAVFVRHARVLPADELRLRGTFPKADRTIRATSAYDPGKDEIAYFLLADNESDIYRKGIDATDGSETLNYGNYGIFYHLDIPIAGKEKTQFYLSPFGGTYAGAMRVTTADGRSQLLLTPSDTTYFGEGTDHMTEYSGIERARDAGLAILTDGMELADLGRYNARTAPTFEFSPPGASNLPVAIILMPGE
ncbi:MAG: copper amine oxidase [Selenomonadaceae bacterium]|nr:copper amine oxidase [Selenomonadaceae bacterium]